MPTELSKYDLNNLTRGYYLGERLKITAAIAGAEILELRAQVAELERRLAVPVVLSSKKDEWNAAGYAEDSDYQRGYNQGVDDSDDAIRAAGYPVKED